MEKQIIEVLKENNWSIAYENIDKVSEKEYQQIRQMGFGASDSSKLLDVNPFPNGTQKDLIHEKLTGEFDESISKKASVRTGKDLEPLIIQKLNESGLFNKVYKPKNMYKANDNTGLTVNFDGVAKLKRIRFHTTKLYPIEIKVVTKYGKKYYAFDKARYHQKDGEWDTTEREVMDYHIDMSNYTIEEKAHYFGIPVYYYTQLQQQMIPLNSQFGYLAVMDLDEWNLYLFYVPASTDVKNEIKKQGTLAMIKLNILKQKSLE